jgi:glutamate-1-semialdehyde 2,1-aminomutase
MAPGGAQQYYGVTSDIVVFGKILGGGFPVGAFAGSREIMKKLDTLIYERPRYSFHGGTFTANPITMTAGLATLKILEDGRLIDKLNKLGEKIRGELREIFEARDVDVQVIGAGSIFNTHFTKTEIRDAADVYKADRKKLMDYNLRLIANGIFVLPTHNGALSIAHSKADVEKLFLETERYVREPGKA